jgi:hypothetical protein
MNKTKHMTKMVSHAKEPLFGVRKETNNTDCNMIGFPQFGQENDELLLYIS